MDNNELSGLMTELAQKKLRIVTAESLTAGLISSTLVNISGASAVVNGGFSVYQDEMKEALLGVPAELLSRFTAVSAPVANAMAAGALKKTGPDVLGSKASNISIAVTGYAGSPGGLAAESDSGLVYIAIGTQFNNSASMPPDISVFEYRFKGNRQAVREKTVHTALGHVQDAIKNPRTM